MTLDPERDGWWDLRTAIMRTSSEWWPELMALIRRDLGELRARSVLFEAPEWWSDDMPPSTAPPHGERRSPRDLMSALQVNLAAVETKFLHDLYEGKRIACGRLGSSLAEYKEAPPWAVIGVESWWKGGGILRLESGEKLYAARVKPTKAAGHANGDAPEQSAATTPTANVRRSGRPVESYKEVVMARTMEWLAEQAKAPRQVKVREFIENAAWELGEDPSDGTTKNYAREALKKDAERRHEGKKGNN
jgi:hypothetical protein